MYSELAVQDQQVEGFVSALCEVLSIRQKDLPEMRVQNLTSQLGERTFSLVGSCPHCHIPTSCLIRGGLTSEDIPANPPKSPAGINLSPAKRICAVTQCQACSKYVLAVVTQQPHPTSPGQHSQQPFIYDAHYPVGSPNDAIGEGIPDEIGEDFKEALRCRFVNAYKATVTMCRRALEGSCEDKKAQGESLEDKIDSLAESRIITNDLKEWAHRIRLSGNRGAHVPINGKQVSNSPNDRRADAVIEFTRQFLEYLYTMPSKIKKFDELSENNAQAAP